ncbi:class I SAM-dependent methyltransferase [Desulforamulus aeronauticus]|uniref:Putative rRNA methylase n=1 Tax=Desulforamulus aeronauticus DSM 10349 TaxID=1121421 RepID=A0A1M6PF31_9FIRM|nr:class I SAM-dependent methyltransferase [Desulforamulus aeronauticus]SHK06543.1 Putative rRNA methylase [Desulforamulus aeronauticus DSM 10349]
MALINWFMVAQLGHHFLLERLQDGDIALDGTMGNGHDTLMLAEAVGSQGKIYAFDVQTQALTNTRERLAAANLLDERIKLIQDGHQNIYQHVKQPIQGAIFNLGYLPGSDKELITQTNTTLEALQQTLHLLAVGGRLVIVVYPGHPGGQEEKEAIENMASQLNPSQYKVLKINLFNRPPSAPGVILIEKVVDIA